MKITEKKVREFAEAIGGLLGIVDLEINARNGYWGIDFNNRKNNLFCGTLRECYYYLKGINDGLFLYRQIN